MLQNVVSAISTKTTIPYLSYIHISGNNNKLKISSTDLDMFITGSVPADVVQDTDILVSGKKLLDIIKNLPEVVVAFKVEENFLVIEAEKYKGKLPVADVADFPSIPSISDVYSFKIKSESIQKLISNVVYAASTDESMPVLRGLNFEVNKNRIRMVATDRHKMALYEIQSDTGIEKDSRIIISRKTASHIQKTIDIFSPDEIEISVSEKFCIFSMGETTVFSKIIEGKYPNYEQVIPKDNKKTAIVNKSILLNKINLVSLSSDTNTKQILFKFSAGSLSLSAHNKETSFYSSEEIPVSYNEEEISIAFNSQFLSETLKLVNTEEVSFNMKSSLNACIIVPTEHKEGENSLFLLMPLRTVEENA